MENIDSEIGIWLLVISSTSIAMLSGVIVVVGVPLKNAIWILIGFLLPVVGWDIFFVALKTSADKKAFFWVVGFFSLGLIPLVFFQTIANKERKENF